MTQRWLAPICAVLALGICSLPIQAQNKMAVAFSTEPDKVVALADLAVRPNTAQVLYLFITNNSGNTRNDAVITITDPSGKTVYAKTTQTIGEPKPPAPIPIKFAKPPAPMAAPGAAPVPPAPMPMPMAPPLPPGMELVSKYDADARKVVFTIVVHVTYEDDNKNKVPEDTPYAVSVRQPITYAEVAKITYRNQKSVGNQLTLDMKSAKFPGGPPCPVELAFPPQDGLNVDRLGEGVYRRLLTGDPKTVQLYAKNLPVSASAGVPGKVYVTVDGVPRAYVYRPKLGTDTGATTEPPSVDRQTDPEIRFMEASKSDMPKSKKIFSRPGIVPIRVEADIAPQGAEIKLKVRRMPEKVEVESITKQSMREERIWFEPAGPDGSMLITTKVGDWVIPVDARDYRGQYELLAELISPKKETDKEQPPPPSMSATLIIDDTKPEIQSITVRPENPKKVNPPEHVRTVPLPVEIVANDPESGIAKVVVFLGKPAPDGKIPETAVEATPPKEGSDTWLAQLPLPMGAKGLQELTVVAVNGVGMPETSSQKVQLLDPPTGGTIKGTVALTPGGKVLSGVTVKLLDAEGKEKGSAKTDEKKNGIFEMKDVPPGTYKVVATKPDSGVGTKGIETVTVKAGEETKVRIILSRKP